MITSGLLPACLLAALLAPRAEAQVRLSDPRSPGTVALFENQLRIEVAPPYSSFALSGDSGSLVVARASADAVGLYFAGPPSGDYGVANPITDVLTELAIALLV